MFLDAKKIFPLEAYEDHFVELNKNSQTRTRRSRSKKRVLPRIKDMLDWGVVRAGDELKVKNHDARGVLLENGHVKVGEEEISLQQWLKQVTGWPSVATYQFTVHVETGKTLSEIRQEYMENRR